VDDVLRLATTLRQHPPLLKKVDAHTLECTLTDISHVPVPAAQGKAYAGLLTPALPQTVRDGQAFRVDVQQHSGPVREPAIQRETAKQPHRVLQHSASASKVLDAFRMTVAIRAGEGLLRRAVRNLAALRYIAQAIPAGDRRYAVLGRYTDQLARQIDALGYDSDLVVASPDDPGLQGHPGQPREHCDTGKVHEINCDCHGCFTGFTPDDCGKHRHFDTHAASSGGARRMQDQCDAARRRPRRPYPPADGHLLLIARTGAPRLPGFIPAAPRTRSGGPPRCTYCVLSRRGRARRRASGPVPCAPSS
jgi:hypothetical protein